MTERLSHNVRPRSGEGTSNRSSRGCKTTESRARELADRGDDTGLCDALSSTRPGTFPFDRLATPPSNESPDRSRRTTRGPFWGNAPTAAVECFGISNTFRWSMQSKDNVTICEHAVGWRRRPHHTPPHEKLDAIRRIYARAVWNDLTGATEPRRAVG